MKLILKTILSLLLITTLCYVSYMYTESEIEKDFNSLSKDVEIVLNGYSSVGDYSKTQVQGKLTQLRDMWGDEVSNVFQLFGGLSDEVFQDAELYDYFAPDGGGWKIYNFEKVTNGIYKTEIYTPEQMGYKVPEKEHIPGGYSTWRKDVYGRPAYDMPQFRNTNRPSVNKAYNIALEHLIDKNISNYKKGSLSQIKYIEDKTSKYHEVRTFNEGIKSPYVLNDQFIIKYNINTYKHYIVKNSSEYDSLLYRNIGISFLLGLILSIIIFLIRNKK